MRLNKNEADWVRLIAQERISKIKDNIKSIDSDDDRKWYTERSMAELETLQSVVDKYYGR